MQLFIYFLSGLTKPEIKILLPFLIGSVVLFNLGMLLSYSLLLPSALQFFVAYESNVVEPIWSFEQYFNFISVLFCTSGLAFQLTILQVGVGILGITSSRKMFEAWKRVILIAVVISAINSFNGLYNPNQWHAILTLYGGGCVSVLIIEKTKRVI